MTQLVHVVAAEFTEEGLHIFELRAFVPRPC